jgi:hypothetical protein
VLVPRAPGVWAADGNLADTKVRDTLRAFLEGYVKFVEGR